MKSVITGGGRYIPESFLAKNFGDIGKFGDIAKYRDMGTKINCFVQKLKTRRCSK